MIKFIICDCKKKHKRKKKLTLTKRIQIHKLKKGVKTMTEIQQDQYGTLDYSFVDDGGEPVDVYSIEATSSNPEFLEIVTEPKTNPGVYPFRLNWVGEGVGTIELRAERKVNDDNPITDTEAFSTIPNIAEGVSKNVVIHEL